jgi:small subunit ribosomal protein S9
MNSKINLQFKKKNIGVGKRKKAIARVFLIPGNGNLMVNHTNGNLYFQYNETYLKDIWLPLEKLNLENQFDVLVFVNGGGLTGQSQAIRLGIAKFFGEKNPAYQKILKSCGFLTRDSRIKERKKYGLRKARKAPQYSKR